jgi:hypothetical protein
MINVDKREILISKIFLMLKVKMEKTIDLIDLELLDELQEAYESRVEDYSIFHTEDYKVDKCSYREFHWVSTTREDDEPYFVVAHSPCGDIINKTGHTPSDLLIQLANISIKLLVDCIDNMEVRK